MIAERIKEHTKHDNGAHKANGARTAATPTAGASPAAANGRDGNGRFTHGNTLGPGNPFARQVAGLRKAFVKQITEQHLAEIADKYIALAKKGDHHAAKLLLAYGVGTPAPVQDPDTLAQHEWSILRAEASFSDDWNLLAGRSSPEVNLPFARVLREAVDMNSREEMQRMGRGMLEQLDREKHRQKRKQGNHLGAAAPAGSYADVSLVAPSANGPSVSSRPGASGQGKLPASG